MADVVTGSTPGEDVRTEEGREIQGLLLDVVWRRT